MFAYLLLPHFLLWRWFSWGDVEVRPGLPRDGLLLRSKLPLTFFFLVFKFHYWYQVYNTLVRHFYSLENDPPNCSFSPPALYLFYSPMIKFPLHFWNHSRGSCYQAQGELTYKTKPQPGKSRHRHICLCHSSFRHPFLFFSDPAPLLPVPKAICERPLGLLEESMTFDVNLLRFGENKYLRGPQEKKS